MVICRQFCLAEPNRDSIKITQEKEMCIAAVISGSEKPQNSPVQHQLRSAGEAHILACRDKKGHTVRREENFINHRDLNLDLFGWGLIPCSTVWRTGAEIEPHREMNTYHIPVHITAKENKVNGNIDKQLWNTLSLSNFNNRTWRGVCDSTCFSHTTTTLSGGVPVLIVCWHINPSGCLSTQPHS